MFLKQESVKEQTASKEIILSVWTTKFNVLNLKSWSDLPTRGSFN